MVAKKKHLILMGERKTVKTIGLVLVCIANNEHKWELFSNPTPFHSHLPVVVTIHKETQHMSEVSTPVRQPTVQEMLHLWKKCENRMKKELLEKSFTLRTNNLSGVHCESFEYRSVNLRRTHNITLPIYNPRSDPHLRYFYAQQRKQQQQQQQQRQHSPARKSDEEDAGTPRSPRTPREEAEKPIIDTALSTEHVLELKKLFLEWSVSENVQTCACSRCPVRAAGVDHEIRHFIMTQELNVHNIVCKGVAITNSHCRLHEHLTHKTPSQELLYDWLALLDGLIVLEWPTFLLLCTADLHHDFITVSRIRSACEGFLQKKPVCSEADYHELLAFLLFNIPAAAASCRTSPFHGCTHDVVLSVWRFLPCAAHVLPLPILSFRCFRGERSFIWQKQMREGDG